ncbi:co-chaperone YbbN [Rothia kristinae]|uniref:co-chaperone YbbN n=1 Tax=Rothia kristinae TaxID=37923 RepID=UPI00119FDFEF|nr:co-chaperone YbbN [Rothia kristinae]
MTAFPDPQSAPSAPGARDSAAEQEIPASARRAPDLAQRTRGGGAPAPEEGQGQPSYRAEITTGEQFQHYAQLSGQGPVVFALYRGSDAAAVRNVEQLEQLIDSAQGRLLLAAADIEQSPEIAQALQAATSLTAIAMLGGRPAPLYDQPVSPEQMQSVLGQVLQLAQQAQLTGGFEPVGTKGAAPAEKPLPPLHRKAQDALEAQDYDAARAAYEQALSEQPGDREAKLGLARVGLLARVADADAQAVRQRAAEAPQEVDAQLAVADLDVAGGHVEDAFARLLKLFAAVGPEEKSRVRERMLELFDVVGAEDPRVVSARAALMRALF